MTSATLFDNPLDAMDELDFLVRGSGLTHRMFKSRKNKYYVLNTSYIPKKDMLVAELNCRNVEGNNAINARRGEKVRQSKIGKKEKTISGLYKHTAPSRGKKRDRS
tara:strand:+ start:254 stop:571 length:318 start_codon:yes stop_codon:yes gene_type:complete